MNHPEEIRSEWKDIHRYFATTTPFCATDSNMLGSREPPLLQILRDKGSMYWFSTTPVLETCSPKNPNKLGILASCFLFKLDIAKEGLA